VLVRDVMTREVETIAPDAPLEAAAARMKELDVGSLPVREGERLLGMVTDRDIAVRGVAAGEHPRAVTVREVMTPVVVSCQEDEEVRAAARVMEEQQIRRLPVLDEAGRLVGIVSLGDLAVRTGDEQLAGEVVEQVSEPTEPERPTA
jgi:CBS domain-containing protein